jgi:hypothetical protein
MLTVQKNPTCTTEGHVLPSPPVSKLRPLLCAAAAVAYEAPRLARGPRPSMTLAPDNRWSLGDTHVCAALYTIGSPEQKAEHNVCQALKLAHGLQDLGARKQERALSR